MPLRSGVFVRHVTAAWLVREPQQYVLRIQAFACHVSCDVARGTKLRTGARRPRTALDQMLYFYRWVEYAGDFTMGFADSVTLNGQHVSLVPLSHAHHDDLVEAVQDGQLWTLWYTSIAAPERLAAEIDRRLALKELRSMVPFAVIEHASHRAVGMTTYMHIDAANRRLEIGSTWYRKRVQRSPVNTECKLLLLTHAFESLECVAVEFRTHFLNRQSRAGIERLGAKLDGVLRQHQVMANGSLRDTCVYSIVDREWPAVKAHLMHQLAKPRETVGEVS